MMDTGLSHWMVTTDTWAYLGTLPKQHPCGPSMNSLNVTSCVFFVSREKCFQESLRGEALSVPKVPMSPIPFRVPFSIIMTAKPIVSPGSFPGLSHLHCQLLPVSLFTSCSTSVLTQLPPSCLLLKLILAHTVFSAIKTTLSRRP